MLSLETSLRKAERHIKNEEFQEAKLFYEKILKKYPSNLRAFEGLRKSKEKLFAYNIRNNQSIFNELLVLFRQQSFERVINLGLKNINLNNQDHLIFNIIGASYQSLKNYNEAIKFYKKTLEINPNFYQAYNNIGHLYTEIKNYEEAKKHFEFALNIKNDDSETHNNIGNVYYKCKNYEKAKYHYECAIKYNPKSPDAFSNLGNVEKETENFDKAKEAYLKAIELNPNLYQAYNNLAVLLSNENNFSEAQINFFKALEINPNYVDALGNLGNSYSKLKNFNTAIQYYQRALSINPKFQAVLNNMGNAYVDLGLLDQSIQCFKDALKINPRSYEAFNNLGNAYYQNENFKVAECNFKQAINLNSEYKDPVFNLALLQLYSGKFSEGWKNFNCRWEANDFDTPKIEFDLPLFNFEKKYESVLVSYEQGIGDQILLSRFLNEFKNKKIQVYASFNSKLHNVIKSSFKHVFLPDKIEKNKVESQIWLGDLPKLFINNFSDVKKSSSNYLKVDKIKSKKIRNLFPSNKKICGLSWLSSNESLGQYKSISLNQLKSILLLDGFEFIDLQYTDTSKERNDFFERFGKKILKIDGKDYFNDIEGLTSTIDACDLILSISNINAHLSGAIGKKTLLMLPKGKGKLWYWSDYDNHSHWYNSVKIFKQKTIGDWSDVIDDVYKDLKSL